MSDQGSLRMIPVFEIGARQPVKPSVVAYPAKGTGAGLIRIGPSRGYRIHHRLLSGAIAGRQENEKAQV